MPDMFKLLLLAPGHLSSDRAWVKANGAQVPSTC